MKYTVSVQLSGYFFIDVEADTRCEAEAKALKQAFEKNWNDLGMPVLKIMESEEYEA